MKRLVFLAALALGSSSSAQAPAPETRKPLLLPPDPPAHGQRTLDTASDLARDLGETVVFLELGQNYFRAFKKGTHASEENAALVKFLETYERERETARKEAEVLKAWTQERSDLEPDAAKQPAKK